MVDDDKAALPRPHSRISAYRAMDGEIDPSIVLHCALALGCDIHLPVITNPRSRSMSFVPLTCVGEPTARSRALAPRWLDLVLVPLVGLAFDLQRVERLPVAPRDAPLRGIVTERGFYRGGGL